jgi:hypothetical protein
MQVIDMQVIGKQAIGMQAICKQVIGKQAIGKQVVGMNCITIITIVALSRYKVKGFGRYKVNPIAVGYHIASSCMVLILDCFSIACSFFSIYIYIEFIKKKEFKIVEGGVCYIYIKD